MASLRWNHPVNSSNVGRRVMLRAWRLRKETAAWADMGLCYFCVDAWHGVEWFQRKLKNRMQDWTLA